METVVAAGSILSGLLEAEHVRIDGTFDGEIRATGWVRIAETARVKGKLTAGDAEIAGAFVGEIDCLRLVLAASANVEGRFVAERMRIDEGALVQGAINEDVPLVPVVPAAPPLEMAVAV
jgi:cytoskeletal protein CcmA (bactofilin family)